MMESGDNQWAKNKLLYWRDASRNALDFCIGMMHLSIH